MAGVTGLLSVDLHQACKLCLLNDGKGVCGLPGSTYPESAGRWCPSTEVHEPSLAADHTFDITTDSGASDAFFDAASDELIYRDDTDTWFKKHGQVFRPMTYVQVQGEAKQFMQLQVATGGFLRPTRSLLSKSKIDNLLTLSRHHFRIDPHLLDECRNLIGCADGTVLDLDTQTLVSQTTAPVTKMVRCSFHPNSDCMEFKRFLGQVFAENHSVLSFVQRAIGYSLSGFTDEQCLFFLVGKGSNGKTTLLNTIQYVFSDYGATTPAQTLLVSRNGNQQTNDLAKLVGIRFVTASETEQGERLAESKLKRITGGDRINCRGLYEEFFEYDPQFKLWLATNDSPKFSGGDYATESTLSSFLSPSTRLIAITACKPAY